MPAKELSPIEVYELLPGTNCKECGESNCMSFSVRLVNKEASLMNCIPLLDPEYFGFNLIAIVGIRISDGKLIETQEKIAEDSHVFAIYDVTGEWDSIVIAHFKSRDDLNSFIKNVLSQKYVDRTVTHIVLNVVKDERRIVL